LSEDDGIRLVQLVLVSVLVVSSLLARRLPFRATIKMALAWAAIFGVLFVGFSFRHDIKQRVFAIGSALGMTEQRIASDGQSVIVRRREDGHFWVDGQINGHDVSLMIDSGASTTALSEETRAATGIPIDAGFGSMVDTANGTITVERITIDNMDIESLHVTNLAAVTSPNFGDTDVLGMNFLDQLQSWSVTGDEMELRP
jgi:aspartyl protease family protein